MRETVRAYLAGDATLAGTLTGGVLATEELSRQLTPGAFDGNGEILPSALVRVEGESPTGPFWTSARTVVVVTVYERSGYATIETALARIFALLERHKFSGTWECRWAGDVPHLRDEALGCSMAISRFVVTRMK